MTRSGWQQLGALVSALSLLAVGCGSDPQLASGSHRIAPTDQQSPLDPQPQLSGIWRARLDGADYLLELASRDKRVTGFVLAPDHSRHPIFSGAAENGSFEFKATEKDIEWQWRATLSGQNLKGERQSGAGNQPQTFLAERLQEHPLRPSAEVGGRWLFRTSNHTFTIDLIVEDQGLRGSVMLPGEASEPIKIGVFSGDAFLFETSGNGHGWLWAGQFSPSGLRGQRENLQNGDVETFTAFRPQ